MIMMIRRCWKKKPKLHRWSISLFPLHSPVSLTYDVFDGKGESTPLVFLHGLFGSKSNFHSIAKSLVQRTGRKVLQWWRPAHSCFLKILAFTVFSAILFKHARIHRFDACQSTLMPIDQLGPRTVHPLCWRPLELRPGGEYSLFPAPLLLSLHSKCPNSPLSS